MTTTFFLSLLLGAFTALGLSFIRQRRPQLAVSPDALPSFLIPAYTTHARLLPIPSRHAFSYSLLYLGIDVGSLESGSLDLPGRLLSYGGRPITKILGLRSDGYLGPGKASLREKLERLLDGRKEDKVELGRVWLMTMPSVVGFEGINPLSVWYCYGKTKGEGRAELEYVVLEVHNTFGEKHAYVLHTDSKHRHEPKSGYDLAWTFPRSFHVSPFNSRNGYYRVDLIDPFGTSSTIPTAKVFLRLFTPAREQKLQALLASSPAYPSILLDPSNTLALVQAVLRYPFALLLTTPRILYQAYWLHYDKKLLVYPRPEPRVEGDEKEWNPSEVDDGGVGVGVGWQQQGWAERKARTIFEDQALRRAKITGIDLQVVFRDQRPSFSTGISGQGERDLVIATSDPKIFTNLLSAPSARHFLVIASELLTTISSPALFERFFQASPDAPGFFDSMSKTIRDRHVRWYWSHSIISPTPDLVSTDTQPMWPNLGYVGYFIVLLSYLADVAEESILHMLGAKFVEVREPWKLWERALARQYVIAAENTDREQGAEDWKAAPEDTALKRSESADEWVDLGSIRYDT